jgi:hypothetical protein
MSCFLSFLLLIMDLYRNRFYISMDPQLSRIAFLCNQLQTQCKKNNNFRTLAIDSLEEILQKFENISNAKNSKVKPTKEISSNKTKDSKVEPAKPSETKNLKVTKNNLILTIQKEESVVQSTKAASSNYSNNAIRLTPIASIDSVLPYDEEPPVRNMCKKTYHYSTSYQKVNWILI